METYIYWCPIIFMQKVDFVIFSKNRALQLKALLESFFHFVDTPLVNSVTVLYKSDPDYLEGYKKLIGAFTSVNFIEESDFRGQTLSIIEGSFNFLCFLVDDIIFYKKVDSPITPKESDVCFSLRMGENSRYSHPANSWYNSPKFQHEEKHIIWDWTSGEYDFGYPFSLDGHVFRKNDILQTLEHAIFRSPNSLENALVYSNPLMEKFKPLKMRSFHNSCLVGIPVNRVNDEVRNRFGLEFFMSESDLQSLFNEGKRIAWEIMDFSTVQGPHKEIEFKFNTEI